MKKTLEIKGLQSIDAVAKEVLQLIGDHRIIAFYGNLGAGKTTLIKALCHQLKVVDIVSSPTFAIINEYRTETDEMVYHFDFYRLKKLQEAIDIGVDEYLDSGNYCFMEWSDRIEEMLPEQYVRIELEPEENPDWRKLILHL
ncbi:MAG: tRNA (adenosine(37)-N6)-threonylcarbamoyltransferase complex ATPase subunit type 1 TsaE [Bacteroidales bacterium]|nr:tRNA (adenosine(37)-N6)-threonylcarbamoyltransferase complex ATPase subunit type 1 TsaE [Bacteroidales bacterium]